MVVLCASVGHHDLPANVRVRVYGGGSRAGRGARFLRGLAGELCRPDRPAVLAHMVPLFLLLAAPLSKARGAMLLLWYTHGFASRSLRLAVRLADAVLTADAGAFPVSTSKLHPIGHAIDVERFSPSSERLKRDGPLQLLALGRFSPVKGYPSLLEGFRRATECGLDAHLELRGPQLTDAERLHHAELDRLVRGSTLLQRRVRLAPAVSREQVPKLLRSVDALLSATQARDSETFDKVVCEAGACGLPVLADNTALDELLGGLALRLRFRADDPDDLAAALRDFAGTDPGVRGDVGEELRRRVVAEHSVSAWAARVAEIVAAHRPK